MQAFVLTGSRPHPGLNIIGASSNFPGPDGGHDHSDNDHRGCRNDNGNQQTNRVPMHNAMHNAQLSIAYTRNAGIRHSTVTATDSAVDPDAAEDADIASVATTSVANLTDRRHR